jgi:hypothetical protein
VPAINVVAMADPLLNLVDFSLVWGPLKLPEPAYSFAQIGDEQLYTPDEIAQAILAVPGVRLTRPAIPDWRDWAARWQEAVRSIEFDIAACPIGPCNDARPGLSLAWGGSKFEMHCLLSDVLRVWRCIQDRCPAVWLHDSGDCQMYSPESFARKFGG